MNNNKFIKKTNNIINIYYLKKNFLFILLFTLIISKSIINTKRNYDQTENYNSKDFVFNNTKIINFDQSLFINRIKKYYLKNGFINLNEIESKLYNGRKWKKNIDKKNEINIGFQIDSKYVLRSMMTLASIMDSQKSSSKIKFHFAVVLNFSVNDMLKIYTLRKNIREDVEFNFYNASRVERDLKGLNFKGPGAVAKLLLPHLLPNDIDRILIFDTGDLLIINDLSEAYNWNMTGFIYAGVPDKLVGRYAKITKKPFDIYINVGNFLVDVKKVKKEKMYEKYVRYKNEYRSNFGDQDLLNDIAFGKITYLPFKFGMIFPYSKDEDADLAKMSNMHSYIYITKYKKFDFLPRTEEEFLKMGYNPVVIHHIHSKWMYGRGLTLFRKLAQYYIKYAGIWKELCKQYPGYCN